MALAAQIDIGMVLGHVRRLRFVRTVAGSAALGGLRGADRRKLGNPACLRRGLLHTVTDGDQFAADHGSAPAGSPEPLGGDIVLYSSAL